MAGPLVGEMALKWAGQSGRRKAVTWGWLLELQSAAYWAARMDPLLAARRAGAMVEWWGVHLAER